MPVLEGFCSFEKHKHKYIVPRKKPFKEFLRSFEISNISQDGEYQKAF